MLYMICPTCKKLLGNKQIYYETHFDQIVKDLEMDKITEDQANEKKQDLLNFVLPDKNRYCCRTRMMTYSRLIEIII